MFSHKYRGIIQKPTTSVNYFRQFIWPTIKIFPPFSPHPARWGSLLSLFTHPATVGGYLPLRYSSFLVGYSIFSLTSLRHWTFRFDIRYSLSPFPFAFPLLLCYFTPLKARCIRFARRMLKSMRLRGRNLKRFARRQNR